MNLHENLNRPIFTSELIKIEHGKNLKFGRSGWLGGLRSVMETWIMGMGL